MIIAYATISMGWGNVCALDRYSNAEEAIYWQELIENEAYISKVNPAFRERKHTLVSGDGKRHVRSNFLSKGLHCARKVRRKPRWAQLDNNLSSLISIGRLPFYYDTIQDDLIYLTLQVVIRSRHGSMDSWSSSPRSSSQNEELERDRSMDWSCVSCFVRFSILSPCVISSIKGSIVGGASCSRFQEGTDWRCFDNYAIREYKCNYIYRI